MTNDTAGLVNYREAQDGQVIDRKYYTGTETRSQDQALSELRYPFSLLLQHRLPPLKGIVPNFSSLLQSSGSASTISTRRRVITSPSRVTFITMTCLQA